MTEAQVIRRLVVGVDGSEHSGRALAWTIRVAKSVDAEVVAVFAIAPPNYLEYADSAGIVPPELDPAWREQITKEFERQWCSPLTEADVRHRHLVRDGRPAEVIARVADETDADLVVVGRRGRGGFAELVLGSVSGELAHHCGRPLVLIATPKAESPKALGDGG